MNKALWRRVLTGTALGIAMLALVTGAPGWAQAQPAEAPAATAAPAGDPAAAGEPAAAPIAVGEPAPGGAATPALGEAHDWQLGFQKPATPVMEELEWFHNKLLMPIITAISAFVLLLLIIVAVRFNARANPVPSKNSHNTLIEVLWTVVPVMVLVVIAIPSFRLLFKEARIPADAALTLKVTGNAWFWSYEYPDQDGIAFNAYIKPQDQLAPGEPRLLTADTKVVVPVGKVVRVVITASDVLHSWAVPAFGVKMDAVPGRINETWFQATREGTFYGQCSELCGKDHAFMPIVVQVVSEQAFATWVDWAKKEYAATGAAPLNVAAASAPAVAR